MNKIEIKSTKDYSLFTKRDRVNVRLINELKKAVQKDNYLMYCPIVVSKDMYILDGHKRYEVSKSIGQPIYFVVREDISCGGKPIVEEPKITQTLQNDDNMYVEWCEKWEDEDIKKTFIQQKDNENYRKLAEFINKLGYSHKKDLLRKCYLIFTSFDQDAYKDFHNGKIKLNNFCWTNIRRIMDISGMTIENHKENTFTDKMLGGTIRFMKKHPTYSFVKIGEWWKTAKPTLVQKCGVKSVSNLFSEIIEELMEKELLIHQ